MLSILSLELPERQLQHLVLRVDHEIQIALFNTASQVALLVKEVCHHVQLCTKRITHTLVNGGLGSLRLFQL